VKKGLTVGAVLTMAFSVELLVQSSSGGGNTFPDRRCILFVTPVICWTRLLQNNKEISAYLFGTTSVQAIKMCKWEKHNLKPKSEHVFITMQVKQSSSSYIVKQIMSTDTKYLFARRIYIIKS